MFDKKWEYISSDTNYNSLSDEIIRIRGIKEIDSFLNPDLTSLHDPFLMNDMHRAVNRIKVALAESQKICVYGDYDADGLTSASILMRCLRDTGAEVQCFIPDRFDDGYGLNIDSLDKIIKKGIKLVITTDCGINSIKEVEFLNKNGVDAIITDHHLSKGDLPDACAVICSTRRDNDYPYQNLSGAGVAYKLSCALKISLSVEETDDNLIALAALGTVADLMPLDGENRIIVSRGIDKMKEGANCGISAILENSSVDKNNISSSTLGFILGPRINAAGRMGNAGSALELLLTDDYIDSRRLAEKLNVLNRKRKKEQESVYTEVLDDIRKNPAYCEFPFIVASGKNYNKGVIGIVASKISEIYKKPSIILSESDGIAEGSGRSAGDISLIDALEYCKEILVSFGGHSNAAGLSLKSSDIGALRLKLAEFADSRGFSGSAGNKLIIDLPTEPGKITINEIEKIDRFKPYGQGNPRPVLSLERVILQDYKIIGTDRKHLKLDFRKNNRYFKAVCFNSSQYEPLLNNGSYYDIAFNAEINVYNGKRNLQLQLRDIRIPDADEYTLDILIVRLFIHMVKYEKSRDELYDPGGFSAKLYEMHMPGAAGRALKHKGLLNISREFIGVVYKGLSCIKPGDIIDIRTFGNIENRAEICLAIEIMIEIGILNAYPEGMYTYKAILEVDKTRKKLEDSLIYAALVKTEG